jgi:hypothetical protein
MSIVVRYAPPGLTKQKYDETVRLFEAEFGEGTPDGCDYHVCFGSDGDLRVSEIWDSREQWEAFGERLMPLLAAAGVNPGQPEVYEVHRLERR